MYDVQSPRSADVPDGEVAGEPEGGVFELFDLGAVEVMAGWLGMSRKSLLRRCASRCSWPVSMLSAVMVISAVDLMGWRRRGGSDR